MIHCDETALKIEVVAGDDEDDGGGGVDRTEGRKKPNPNKQRNNKQTQNLPACIWDKASGFISNNMKAGFQKKFTLKRRQA